MKIYLSILLLFFTNIISAQFTYNAVDTSYRIKFKEFSIIADTIETLHRYKLKSENHEVQLGILMNIIDVQDTKIIKLERKDSLCTQELSIFKQMDNIQKSNLKTALDISSDYKSLIVSKDYELGLKDKEIKNQKNWKNVYKYGYPLVGILVGLLIITN